MKTPEIVYCNIIRKDKNQGEVAIKGRHLEEMIDVLIEANETLKTAEKWLLINTLHKSPHTDNLIRKIEDTLKQVGCTDEK